MDILRTTIPPALFFASAILIYLETHSINLTMAYILTVCAFVVAFVLVAEDMAETFARRLLKKEQENTPANAVFTRNLKPDELVQG